MRAKGYVVFESRNIVGIVTLHSSNIKTGDMAQLWILNKHKSPCAAAADGSDRFVCGDCKHRPANLGTCYVTLFQGPGNVYKAYRAGKYPYLKPADYRQVFAGRAIRFGAYGDPAYIPFDLLWAMHHASAGTTGYTHQWRKCDILYSDLLMASVDNLQEYQVAKRAGWRTFRVSATGTDNMPAEITCPASAGKVQCVRCKLCCGRMRQAKDITIKVHGSRAHKFAA